MTSIYPDEVRNLQLGDPEYGPEIEEACDAIHTATKGFGTDEQSIINTLGSFTPSQRFILSQRYKEKFGKDLYNLVDSETSFNFGTLAKLLSLPIPEAEAKIIRMATKGIGTNEKLLWPVICGRTNEEMNLLKKAYFKRYNEDLAILLSSELSGDLKKLALACVQGLEEEFDPSYHTESRAAEDAKLFYKAGQGRWGTDEETIFGIICKSPPKYLKMVDSAYVEKNNVNLERALEKELSGKAKKAAIYELGMKLSPYETVAELIKQTCAGMGTDELGLSCAILRYQTILPHVMIEHTNMYSKTIQDRVQEETSGYYKDLLLEMIHVVWPSP
mmetsp:Transcript_7781/g.16218  ORF Transcript_7781/g.16218 Transcript_7781/m.16218 type:complete len:331 (-) Transcript_7781:83-1075(-)